MSGLTGYLTNNGIDLSYVFLHGGPTTTQSGYYIGGGGDLSSIFAPYNNTMMANPTGYLTSSGTDLSSLYAPLLKWKAIGNGVGSSTSTLVYCIYYYDETHIYVGGSPSVFHMWNGSSWNSLGTVNGQVNTIYVYDLSHIYVGGSFTTMNGYTAKYMAMYDGNSWSQVGSFDGLVNTINVYDLSHVFVGGAFSGFAKVYNSYSGVWSSFCSAITGTAVYQIIPYNLTNIFVGGQFTSTGCSSPGIIKSNGSTSTSMGSGVAGNNLRVLKVYVYDLSNVYIAGDFVSINGITNGVAKWNDWSSTWTSVGASGSVVSSVGSGGSYVAALYVYDLSHVYIGGKLTTPAGNIAIFNGSSWVSLGTTNAPVQAFGVIDSTHLLVGGSFTTVNSTTYSTNIVIYGGA